MATHIAGARSKPVETLVAVNSVERDVYLCGRAPRSSAWGALLARRLGARSQHAYLPNDQEGRRLLGLFALAFRRRVLFGLGPSMATGQVRPTFAIHLKTSTCGGPERHGFPDPGYYQNALEEFGTSWGRNTCV